MTPEYLKALEELDAEIDHLAAQMVRDGINRYDAWRRATDRVQAQRQQAALERSKLKLPGSTP